VALYFSWQITLACFIMVPVLALSFYMILQSGAGGDGILGKEAYEAAANVADEALSSMTTVAAFTGETKVAKRYEDNLVEAEKAAIRQGKKLGFGTGLLWASFYAMMGIGFWWGGKLVLGSTKQAMIDNPIPSDFHNNTAKYGVNKAVAEEACKYRPLGTFGKGDFVPYEGEAFEICACGLPWPAVADTIDNSNVEWAVQMRGVGISGENVAPMTCGCSKDDGFSLGSKCVSAGRTMAVFFSVMIAGFLLALIPPAFQAIGKARMAASKLYAIIDRRPDIDSSPSTSKSCKFIKGRITIEGLHFQYPTGATKIFNDINLDITAGETVALVGESGSGKSTIARLVSRFYDPQQGRVCIDGNDVRDLDVRSMRDHIGVVSQEPLLFDASIAENIARGKAGPEPATQEEIEAAARAANAYDFIQSFPDGFNTQVGARGGKLSGGQKQRIAIARALIRKPSVLILDEATSALDTKSEKVVQAAIDNLVGKTGTGGGITTIIIAHRLSTVKNADRIVVLGSKEGTSTANGSTIVEIGNHEELMSKKKGLYRALVGGSHSLEGPEMYSGSVKEDDPKHAYSDITKGAEALKHSGTTTTESTGKDGDDNANTQSTGTDKSQKEKDEKIENDFKKKVDKKRLRSYSTPEKGHFMMGLIACFCTGMAFPICGILFSLMISAMVIADLDYAQRAITYLAVSFGILAVFMLVAQFFQTYLFEIIGERMTTRIRTDYFRTLVRQDIAWFDDPANSLGVLTSRLAIDVKLIRLTVGQSTGATVSSMTSLMVGVIIALVAAWQFALAFIATVPLLALSEMINWAIMKGSDSDAKKQLGVISGQFGEYVQGIREVQSFGLETFVTSEISVLLEHSIVDVAKKAALFRGFSAGSVQVIQLGVYALAFYIGAKLMDNGVLDYEMFMLVLWSLGFGASGMGQAANWVAAAAKGKAAAVRVFELFDRKPPIDCRPWNEDGSPREVITPKEANGTKGEIEFRNVKFAYPTRKTARVFDDMSLKIPAGQTAALIGSSGSGKSTVMALLERFYDPVAAIVDSGKKTEDEKIEVVIDPPKLDDSNGVVYVDGTDIRAMDVMYLRQSIGLVGQEPVLFDASVRENISLGKDGASDEEIISAAKIAHAHDFISKFSGGYDYNVGIRGKKVSGGQKQRIAIARAVLKNPRILLLDEATSALDNESEKIVQLSLDELIATNKKNHERTTVVIAHRLSTVRNADCIYVLENSGDGAVVVESGNHEHLIALNGKYKALLEATMAPSKG